jgi:transcriptional regulator with XRE-family HTH domain
MPMVLTFGERVAFLRRRRGWTQADLAAKLGVRGNTISRIEKSTHGKGGFEDVKGKTVAALARHLRVSADYLLGLSEDDHEIPWSLLPSAEDQATPSPATPRAGEIPPSRRRTAKPKALLGMDELERGEETRPPATPPAKSKAKRTTKQARQT